MQWIEMHAIGFNKPIKKARLLWPSSAQGEIDALYGQNSRILQMKTPNPSYNSAIKLQRRYLGRTFSL
jgi:hypothetical protein